jgi:hypothetical protein
MKINYDNRIFKLIENSPGGEVSGETTFHYHQQGELVWAEYAGGAIVFGNLIAKVLPGGVLEMRYQHLNSRGELMTGRCVSVPKLLANGKLKM